MPAPLPSLASQLTVRLHVRRERRGGRPRLNSKVRQRRALLHYVVCARGVEPRQVGQGLGASGLGLLHEVVGVGGARASHGHGTLRDPERVRVLKQILPSEPAVVGDGTPVLLVVYALHPLLALLDRLKLWRILVVVRGPVVEYS